VGANAITVFGFFTIAFVFMLVIAVILALTHPIVLLPIVLGLAFALALVLTEAGTGHKEGVLDIDWTERLLSEVIDQFLLVGLHLG
jgi:ABC-type multidrug transport system fused ATPase/permease subunit